MAVLDTYPSTAEANHGRAQQQRLLAALDAWDRALRKDICGAWCIQGARGSIHTWGDGQSWLLAVECRSAKHWTWTKRALDFCTVTQDGGDEGCLRLHGLPTPEEAEAIREALGIRKRRDVSEAERERLKALGFKAGTPYEPTIGARIDETGSGGGKTPSRAATAKKRP